MQHERDQWNARLVYGLLVLVAVVAGAGVVGGALLVVALMLAGPASDLGRTLPFWPAFTGSFASFIVLIWIGMLLVLWDVRLR
ncbi:MAG: hypothetical protein EXR63_04780 [Dehalococcoidia bacterium]|nr:hypothetical protein [Dehalococcoidia bacterium]